MADPKKLQCCLCKRGPASLKAANLRKTYSDSSLNLKEWMKNPFNV